ncbi:MAG: conjugative transfer signal peptidase TraF [Dehalococcoidia bacterium]|nr:conjugative transfer signal peptidase TraF [Dehalococcoidia bacterium]
MSLFKRLTSGTARVGSALLALGMVCHVVGARINTSGSIPIGLYWMTERPLAKGEYVLLCPPPGNVFDEAKRRGYFGAGFCPGDYAYLMKKILAAKKDKVSVSDEGVRVNGELLPFSRPLSADKQGRPLPVLRGEYQLGDSDVLLMTDVSPLSFDSRYFGLVNRSQIKGVIRPVFTW